MSADDKTWIKVAPCADIPPREGRCVEVAGRPIAIFHTSEGFLAVDNRCPHRGGPLADGIVNGPSVVCPLHAWKFDLFSGASINHPDSSGSLTTYPTCIREGVICIEFPQPISCDEVPATVCEHRDRPIRWVQRKLTPTAARPGDVVNSGSSSSSDPPPKERRQSNGYVSQEF